MPTLEFFTHGRPVPQGSKTRMPNGALVEANKALPSWRAEMVATASAAAAEAGWETATGPVVVEVTFVFSRPRSHYGTGRNASELKPSAPGLWHTQKPDGDKLTRALFDALKLAGIVRDDACMAKCTYEKWWGQTDYMAVQLWTG